MKKQTIRIHADVGGTIRISPKKRKAKATASMADGSKIKIIGDKK
jgi:hypothetical protein